MKKKLTLTLIALVLLILPTAIVHADLVGRYSWGYFYSNLSSSEVEAEVVSVTNKYVCPVAQNSQRIKYGKYVRLGNASRAALHRTKHGNRTYYNFK